MKKYILVLLSIPFFLISCSDSDEKITYIPSSKTISIKSYKLGIHPYLNSKKMYRFYRPILDHVESKVGNIEIILETSANYAEYNIKLYRGDFDFSLPNPFQTYNSLSKGYTVIGRMKPDSVFRGIFVTRKDSNIKTPSQLKGKKVSFPAPTALAATMMPLYYLYEHGIDVKNDIKKKYVGSQDSSILNSFTSDTIVGATWPPPWETWKKENPQKAKKMEVVWETESLINNGFVVKEGIDSNITKKIIDILVNLDETQEGKRLLNEAGFEGFTKSTNEDYNVVSEFLVKYDKAIGIPK